MAQVDKSHPGLKVKKLLCVTADNRNKYYNMFEQPNGTFIGAYGRVDGNESYTTKPMREWDKVYREKTKRKVEPYTDKTDLYIGESKTVTTGGKKNEVFSPKRAAEAVGFIKDLMSHAGQFTQANYNVQVTAVTKAQVEAAQRQLNKLTDLAKVGSKVDDFNQALLDLWMIIPRKMKNTKFHLIMDPATRIINDGLLNRNGEPGQSKDDVGTKQGVNQILVLEQDTLDVMAGQVNANLAEQQDAPTGSNKDLLDTLGLDCEIVTNQSEIEMIKKKMDQNAKNSGDQQSHRFLRAFRVSNKKTDFDFEKHISGVKNKGHELLWHGSRNENWWSIIQSRLMIRPTNAVITGKMFGYGIYFADKAVKSIGYTSGGYYAGGRGNGKGYLALYDIHKGNQYEVTNHKSEHSSLDWNKLQKYGPYDSLFAKGGADLRNNEYIVYQEPQCTLRYIVEFRA